ncbi:MAG: glycosyltransferase family 2 protein [Lachnospiraceae bacterium]|jgi:Glycosyltransferases involved in cell wall biogenesis|nr:glycosyltransferase family 2 protein [Lachnospiraceae bacterium]
MQNKILTISIAAYNVDAYIETALQSLFFSDNLDELEVLIINDGSTDRTAKIAEQYTKKYPDIFRLVNKENGGYGSTINTAIKIAKGKYFKQLDGDDWFDKENIKEFLEFLRASEADCIFSPFWKVYQHQGKKEMLGKYNPQEKRLSAKDITMYALTFKTTIFTKYNIQFSEKYFYTDCEYNVKPLMFVNKTDFFDKPIYIYRLEEEGQSVSKEGWLKHYYDHNKVTLEIMSYYKRNKSNMIFFDRDVIENYILNVYKTNFSIALELDDRDIYYKYRKLDLRVKEEFPEFYNRKNKKMAFLTQCGYRSWKMISVYHKFFEKTIFS